jgi:hypothetical protein
VSSSSAIAFFIVKEPAKPKAKSRQSGLSKSDRAAVSAYVRADAIERKRLLRNQVTAENQAKLIARRAWRRGYQAQYRAMRMLATVIL